MVRADAGGLVAAGSRVAAAASTLRDDFGDAIDSATDRFALARDSGLLDAAVAAAVHPDAGDADGEPEPVTTEPGDPTPPDGVLERLGAAFVRADLVVRRVGDRTPPAFSVLSGPDGCWTIDPPAAPGEGVRAVPVTAADARERVAEAVAGVRAELAVLRD